MPTKILDKFVSTNASANMKKIYCTLALFCAFVLCAQINAPWVHVQGTDSLDVYNPTYGHRGLEDPDNWQRAAYGITGVPDSSGKVWVFGGDMYNQLWSFDPATNNFTFQKGDFIENWPFQYSIALGTEHYLNTPSARKDTQLWADAQDNIWLFGGNQYQNNNDYVNDLWKYNKATGNWVQLSVGGNLDGVYGQQGVANAANIPPGLANATTWADAQGNLWLFGGFVYELTGISEDPTERTNTLWKYDVSLSQWIWISGSSTANQQGSYNQIGQESALNYPGARQNAIEWTDANGNFWIFGGSSIESGNFVNHNDIWKFNPVTGLWTWVKGTATSTLENIAAPSGEAALNMPAGNAARVSGWKDASGNFWLYGTEADHLWKYNPVSNNWAFIKGSTGNNIVAPQYGTIGVGATTNTPGDRYHTVSWASGGNLYLYSGGQYASSATNMWQDIWKFDTATNQWTWIKGCNDATCVQTAKLTGTEAVEISPASQQMMTANSWKDAQGNLWLYTEDEQLWHFNTANNSWKWINGNITAYNTVEYTAEGVASTRNLPPGVNRAATWTDNSGNLWMYGGVSQQPKSDMWKYDPVAATWTLISGTGASNQYSIVGTQGTPAAANNPGGRFDSLTWKDDNGNFWLYGGQGMGSAGTTWSYLNDLWMYNPNTNQWTWVKGSTTSGGTEVSSGIGLTSATDTPAAYYIKGTNWKDNDNNLWLFVKDGVWKYSVAENAWTKMHVLYVQFIQGIVYGTPGVAALTNSPGKREGAASWTDAQGNLILYGGVVEDPTHNNRADIWKYSVSSNMWTFIGGSTQYNLTPNYGEPNVASFENFPGTRISGFSWTDNYGNNYLFGGQGFEEYTYGYRLADVWKMAGQFNTVSGTIRFDSDANGCTSTDIAAAGVKVLLQDGANNSFTFTDVNGNYAAPFLQPTATLTPEHEYTTATPASQTINFTGYQQTEVQDFCLTANSPVNDLEVTIIPVTEARPGFDAKYRIILRNVGTTTQSGALTFTFPDDVADFVSATPAPALQQTGSLQWNYTNLQPFAYTSTLVTLNLNTPTETPALIGGEVIQPTAQAIVTADATVANNTFVLNQDVVNSLDPNDKTCLQGAAITQAQVGGYVDYLIRFENTGSANAINVIVSDDIDASKFDISSIVPVSGSHNYRLEVSGNRANFIFEYINLPFYGANKYGYIAFKIRTVATLQEGDQFSNTAGIYFDYNLPVITNTAVTEVNTAANTPTLAKDAITAYPNPVKDVLTIQANSAYTKAEVYDLAGRMVLSSSVINNTINMVMLKAGVYIVKVKEGKKENSFKIVKQ